MNNYPRLSSIGEAHEIRALSLDAKKELAEELRDYIIETVARTGGHLAPNLGVIELTIALLSAGDFPRDSVIFDVGHQSYAWKILTGRRDLFPSLRQEGGLSGFPKTSESEFDVFNTGHSSTSISAALGLARAKRAKGDHSWTIALIGDGALGAGMAFEALSDAGQSHENLLVILNDNQMCIDQAVGGMARHLEQLRTSTRYIHMKTVWEKRLEKLPLLGRPLLHMLARQKRRWRSWKKEAGAIFEQLGFRYYGPVDGHEIGDLERHLKALRLIRGPVLLHAITVKGKGYCYAEDEPEIFHGVSPFDTSNGQSNGKKEKEKTFSQIFGETLTEMAQTDPDITAITAAMAQGTGLIPFQEAHPDRFFDVGIAEQHAVTMAAGLALGGLRPYVAIYSTFLQRAADQLIHDVCLQNLPVVLGVDRAGLVGADGDTHQGAYDLSMFLSVPNLTIMAPATAADLRAMLLYSRKHEGPLMIRYPNDRASNRELYAYPDKADELAITDFYQLRQLSEGRDMTIVALGPVVWQVMEALEILKEEIPEFSADLYSCVTASPFDYETMLDSIHRTRRLFIVEEAVELGGFGAVTASETIRVDAGLLIDYAGVRQPDRGQASREELRASEGLDQEGLAGRIYMLLQRGLTENRL